MAATSTRAQTFYIWVDPVSGKNERLTPIGGSARYFLRHHLAKGEYGNVFLCHDIVKKRDVCIKAQRTIRENGQKKAYHEAAIMKYCTERSKASSHAGAKNVIKYLDSFEDTQLKMHYIVMPYAMRGDMVAFTNDMAKETFLYGNIVRAFSRDILLAVHFLHSIGVYHRDIKVENFVVMWDDEAGREGLQIVDFGFATLAAGELTRNHTLGSLPFCAPELLMPDRYENFYRLDQVDVWALMACIFTLMHNRFPFVSIEFDVDDCSAQEFSIEIRRCMNESFLTGPVESGVGCVRSCLKDRHIWAPMFREAFVRPDRRPSLDYILEMDWPRYILMNDAQTRCQRNASIGTSFLDTFLASSGLGVTGSTSARAVHIATSECESSDSETEKPPKVSFSSSPRPRIERDRIPEPTTGPRKWFQLDFQKLRRKNRSTKTKQKKNPLPASDPYR